MVVEAVIALSLFQTVTAHASWQLQQVEDRLAETWQKGDCAAWGELVAPD